MFAKRIFDISLVVPSIVILSPLLALVYVLVKLDSPGPAIFKQQRVGKNSNPFKILKFRTMVVDAETAGPKITIGQDKRITKLGIILRKYKIDELPQLYNVLVGEMSLVGPRPEVEEYVVFYPSALKKIVLSVPPGITDEASIRYKDESAVLANSEDPIRDYKNIILPIKLEYGVNYVLKNSVSGDIKLILQTIWTITR